MWPKTGLVFVPKARVRVGCHKACAIDELRLDVVNEFPQLSSRGSKHAVMQVGRHVLNLSEKGNEMCGLPHEGSAWVFAGPKNVALLAQEDQFTGDPIQLICFVHSFLLFLGQPREAVGIGVISQRWWHRLISILDESGSGCCATRWCKMHIYTNAVVDEFLDKLQMIGVK